MWSTVSSISLSIPADRGFTAFHSPIGTYKWNVLPQGTSASPQIFQRAMDRWFSAFLWKSVIVWIDDLLVHSQTFEDHLRHLREVFQVAERYGLIFNRAKLKLCQRRVKYIGYPVDDIGKSTQLCGFSVSTSAGVCKPAECVQCTYLSVTKYPKVIRGVGTKELSQKIKY